MTRALALLPLLTLTACAIEPGVGSSAPGHQSLRTLFAALTVPCGCATALGLILWADPEASVELGERVVPAVIGPALMWVVLVILAGPI